MIQSCLSASVLRDGEATSGINAYVYVELYIRTRKKMDTEDKQIPAAVTITYR